MLNSLKPKSEFSRNVLTLMTGTTIAQAIPIAISPILTRIYTPEDFGVFALFVAITSIFGSIANGRYELAIMLPQKDEDAINIFALGFLITLVISVTLLILVLIFNGYFIKLLNNKEIGIWLYFIPITVFLMGLFNVLTYFNNRKKRYNDLAKSTIIKSIVLAIVQLSVGFIKQGVSGLIIGQIISQFFANTKLLLNIIKNKMLISKISKIKMIALAKRYKNFPKFSMWAILANTLTTQLLNILIPSFFGIATLGFYSLVQRVLGMPSALVGGAIGQVFFQEATKEKQNTGTAINSLKNTLRKLLIIALPIFGILFFIAEDLFSFVFGEKWKIAGEYTKILVPFFFIRFISSTISIILVVYEKQKNELFINFILIATSLSVFFMMDDFIEFLYVLSFSMSIHYFLFLFYYYKLAKGSV